MQHQMKILKLIYFSDIRFVKAGEKCPHCEGYLKEARGIEVGQVFELGDKYSSKKKHILQMRKTKTFIMGCYGWSLKTLEQ